MARSITAYERGVSACRRGRLTQDNPFTHETSRQSEHFRAWLQGFADQARKEADEAQERAKNTPQRA